MILPDLLESVARLRVKVEGTFKGARREIDFKSSDSSVTITGTDDGLNEKMTLDFVSAASGTDLWESVADDLHPITDPDSMTVTTVGDGTDKGIVLDASHPGVGAGGGIILLTDDEKIGIFTGNEGGTGSIEINAASGITIVSGTGDIDITAGGTGLQDVNIAASDNVFIQSGTTDSTDGFIQLAADRDIYLQPGEGVIHMTLQGSAPSISGEAKTIAFYIDEGTNTLKVKVCYADGTTVKTGTIALL